MTVTWPEVSPVVRPDLRTPMPRTAGAVPLGRLVGPEGLLRSDDACDPVAGVDDPARHPAGGGLTGVGQRDEALEQRDRVAFLAAAVGCARLQDGGLPSRFVPVGQQVIVLATLL